MVQERYQCGPAALAMALTWGGDAVSAETLVPIVYMPGREGSLQKDMIGAARRRGRLAHPIAGLEALYTEVAAGHPVIVLEDFGFLGWSKWHYSVVVGIDPAANRIVLHSGRAEPWRRSLNGFLHTWERSERWGLVVLTPESIPASGGEADILKSISGLEQAEQWAAAAHGYRAVLERWPASPEARFGLGNSLYALGDRAGAQAAFKALCDRNPPFASGCNNLAHVLMELDRQAEALEAARKAVAAGGPLAPVFNETLQTILGTEANKASEPTP